MKLLVVRGALVCAALLLFLMWQAVLPARPAGPEKWRRRGINLGLQVLNAAMLALLSLALPTLLAGVAFWAETRRLGLLHYTLWSYPVKFWLSFIALDLALYAQHRLLHVGPFWRLHRLHHTDLDLDATTGLRFHPGEILFSFAFKAVVICLLGVHFLVVPVFESALALASLFTHANAAVPLEGLLRLFIVTPSMHLTHHSVRRDEADANFGFLVSLWDRAFGTYRAAPQGVVQIGAPR